MRKKRSSNREVEIKKVPANMKACPLVLGRDPSVSEIMGVHYQVTRCLKKVCEPLSITAHRTGLLD